MHVVIHSATSVDGRIDGFRPDIERYYGLATVWDVDAHLVGADTLLAGEDAVAESGADQVTAADIEAHGTGREEGPLLVVTDSRGRIDNWERLLATPLWSDTLVLCSETTPRAYLDTLDSLHIPYHISGSDHADLEPAMAELEARGIGTVLVDSGGTLNGAVLRAGLADELSVLVHPHVVGGTTARSFVRGPDPDGEATELTFQSVEVLDGGLVWLRYRCG